MRPRSSRWCCRCCSPAAGPARGKQLTKWWSWPGMAAVVAGVQIHNWGTRFDDDSPNLEFVAPTSVYVVVNGEKTHLDLTAMPVGGYDRPCGS
jgi:hypothetical protein